MKRRFWACTMIASLLVFNMPVNVLAGCSGGTANKTCTNWKTCYGNAQRVYYLANIACGKAFADALIDCSQKETEEKREACRKAALKKKGVCLAAAAAAFKASAKICCNVHKPRDCWDYNSSAGCTVRTDHC